VQRIEDMYVVLPLGKDVNGEAPHTIWDPHELRSEFPPIISEGCWGGASMVTHIARDKIRTALPGNIQPFITHWCRFMVDPLALEYYYTVRCVYMLVYWAKLLSVIYAM
jgi:hypothetical protein